MKKSPRAVALILAATLLLSISAQAAQRTWLNTGTDFNAAASWTGGSPAGSNVAFFNAAEVTQPNVTASISTSGLFFSGAASSGYDITSSAGAVLTLTGQSTTGTSGVADGSAAAIRNEITSGTNTVEGAIVLASSTGTSSFVQSGAGTLIVNGAISGNALSLRGGAGVIQLNGGNSFAAASIDTAGTTVTVGSNSGLGAGTFTNGATSTLQAGGGARTLSNTVVLAGNMTVGGSNAFTFNGSFTSSGSSSRTLTVSNTGGTTLGGNVFLSEDNTTAGRVFIINGSTATVINGVITNNNVGNTLAAGLRYSGTSTLTLNSTNTYSGGTGITVTGGTIIANTDGALGTGNVNLTATGVTLTLQNGAVNNYIANSASISIVTGAVANLNFTGASDLVSGITLGGVAQATPGTYGSATSGATFQSAFFSGTGTLTLIPEPATYMLFGLGVLVCAQQFLRRRKV